MRLGSTVAAAGFVLLVLLAGTGAGQSGKGPTVSVCVAAEDDVECDHAAASVTGNATANEGPAASGTGNASGEGLAASGAGDARCREPVVWAPPWPCAAASGAGNATSGGPIGAVVAPAGDADAGGIGPAASGTGNAEGGVVGVSGTGGTQGAVAASGTGDASGYEVGVSGTGDASGFDAAVSGTGDASAFGAAASGTGDTEAIVAASGTGNASGFAVAASGTGESEGFVAASGAGPAAGAVAVSGTDDAQAWQAAVSGTGNATSHLVAASGTGDATGSFPVSATGDCRREAGDEGRRCQHAAVQDDAEGYYAAASGQGDAEAPAAASGTGDARGEAVGASGTGEARGGGAASGAGSADGGTLAASGTGPAEARFAAASVAGSASGGFLAVSALGEAECTGSVCLAVDRDAHEQVDPPSAGEAGHHGVGYGNLTYQAAKFLLRSEEDRGGEVGPPRAWEDGTERSIDVALESVGLEEATPDTNSTTMRNVMDLFVWGPIHGLLDDTFCTFGPDPTCASDVTGHVVVDFLLEGFAERILPVDAAWGCGHAAVDAVDDSADPDRGCQAPLP